MVSGEPEPHLVKALKLIAERDPVRDWEYNERLVVVSLAFTALQMFEQVNDQERHDAKAT